MTLDELNELFDLRQKLREIQAMRRSFMDAARPGAQVLTGMPHATEVKDKVGTLAVEIAHLDTRAEEIQARIAEKETSAERFIRRIPDDRTQMVFRLRFMHGMTWPEVAKKFGGRNTEGSVRMICYRYFSAI